MSWAHPIPNGKFVDDFGPRNTGIPGASTYHRGVDLSRGDGKVRAAGDGTVLAVGTNSVRGKYVVIRHGDGTTTTYQHLSSTTVKAGASVVGSQIIGVQGETGTAQGVHLHFETFPKGRFLLGGNYVWVSVDRAVDPEPFMKARGVNLRGGTTPTKKKRTDMIIYKVGSSVYRAICGDRVVTIPVEQDALNLIAGGVPFGGVTATTDKVFTTTLTSEMATLEVEAGGPISADMAPVVAALESLLRAIQALPLEIRDTIIK